MRPIHHRLANRVRAHIFLCMLAFYIEWHMREAWRVQALSRRKPPLRYSKFLVVEFRHPALEASHECAKPDCLDEAGVYA